MRGEPTSRRARRPSLATRLLALGLGSVVCWTVVGFAVQFLHTYTLAREAAGMERRRQNLLAENASLLLEIQRLRTDDHYLERLAREQLGMLRPGEIELVIVPAPLPRHPLIERDGARNGTGPPADGAQSVEQFLWKTAQEVRDRLLDVLGTLARSFRPRP